MVDYFETSQFKNNYFGLIRGRVAGIINNAKDNHTLFEYFSYCGERYDQIRNVLSFDEEMDNLRETLYIIAKKLFKMEFTERNFITDEFIHLFSFYLSHMDHIIDFTEFINSFDNNDELIVKLRKSCIKSETTKLIFRMMKIKIDYQVAFFEKNEDSKKLSDYKDLQNFMDSIY